MSATDIWLLCAPKSATFDVQNFLSNHEIRIKWTLQPHTPGTLQTRFKASLSDGEVAKFGTLLSKLGVVFEIYQSSQEPCLLVGHPGLGLKRLAIDLSGDIVIRMGQLEQEHSPWLKFSIILSTLLILFYFISPSQLVEAVSKINFI